VDTSKRRLEERERLGEFQIADPELRQKFDGNWTSAYHPNARLIEEAAMRDFCDYNLRGKAPSNSASTSRAAGVEGSRIPNVTPIQMDDRSLD
jgi:hypothetical protein